MAEPAGKRVKSGLPLCAAHRSSAGGRAERELQAAVEEALCGVSSLLRDGAYRLRALQEALKQEEEAEAMLGYLAERGGNFCGKDIQTPGCEGAGPVLPALGLLMLQLKEEVGVLAELSRLARHHGDPHTAGVVKSHFLSPRARRLKLLGDLITNARRVGCTNDQTGGFGESILNELQEEPIR